MPRDRDISKPADWKSAIQRSAAQPAQPQPNLAKRVECVQLAGAFVGGWRLESGSKLLSKRFAQPPTPEKPSQMM